MKKVFLLLLITLSLNVWATTYKLDEGNLIDRNFFELFGQNIKEIDTSNDKIIWEEHGVSLIYYSRKSSYAPPLAAIRIEGIEYHLFCFELDDKFNIKSIYRISLADNAPVIALNLVREFTGIQELAINFGIPTSGLDSPELQKEFENFEKYRDQQAAIKAREESIMAMSTIVRGTVIDSDDAFGVLQHQYSILKYDSNGKYKALKTFGAGPCVIVSIYDKNNKVGMLAHIDAITNFQQSMSVIHNQFNRAGGELYFKSDSEISEDNNIEIHIVGGDYSSRLQLDEIRTILEQYKYSSFNQNILTYQIENAWLDLATGKVSSFEVNPTLKTNKLPPMFDMMVLSAGPILEIKRADSTF